MESHILDKESQNNIEASGIVGFKFCTSRPFVACFWLDFFKYRLMNLAQGLSKYMESTQQITDGAMPFFDNDYSLIYNCLLLPIR